MHTTFQWNFQKKILSFCRGLTFLVKCHYFYFINETCRKGQHRLIYSNKLISDSLVEIWRNYSCTAKHVLYFAPCVGIFLINFNSVGIFPIKFSIKLYTSRNHASYTSVKFLRALYLKIVISYLVWNMFNTFTLTLGHFVPPCNIKIKSTLTWLVIKTCNICRATSLIITNH